jgi:multidrug resistance efflux pump
MKSAKIILPIILALVLAACGSGAPATAEATPMPTVVADDIIIAEGKIEPIHFTELSLTTSGLVSEILLEEGDTVEAGDIIAILKSEEAQTLTDAQAAATQELTEAYQEFRDARSKLDDFDVPSQFSGMTPPEAVAAMLEKLNQARADFEPYKHLDDKTVNYAEPKVDTSEMSPEELERHYELQEKNKNKERPVTGDAKVKKKALDNAWNLYRLSIQWLELETKFQNAEARLVNAQKDYEALHDPDFEINTAGIRAVLANAELRAPYSGVVTDLDLKVGEFASTGEPVVTIADTSKWIVKTDDLTEIDVVNIEEGQPVTVKLDALSGMEFKGNVLSISQNFSENQGDVVYEVTILLTDFDPAMRWGMTAVVTFE